MANKRVLRDPKHLFHICLAQHAPDLSHSFSLVQGTRTCHARGKTCATNRHDNSFLVEANETSQRRIIRFFVVSSEIELNQRLNCSATRTRTRGNLNDAATTAVLLDDDVTTSSSKSGAPKVVSGDIYAWCHGGLVC